jgi:hypothetical protein
MLGKHLKNIYEALQIDNTLSEALLHMLNQQHVEFLDFQKQCYQQQQDWIDWCKQNKKEEEDKKTQEKEAALLVLNERIRETFTDDAKERLEAEEKPK